MAKGKHKVKNISAGPRFFHSSEGGTVTLDPGQEWEGPIDPSQFDRRDPDGMEFQIDGKASKALQQEIKTAVKTDDYDKLTDQQLRDHLNKQHPKKPLPADLTRDDLLALARA